MLSGENKYFTPKLRGVVPPKRSLMIFYCVREWIERLTKLGSTSLSICLLQVFPKETPWSLTPGPGRALCSLLSLWDHLWSTTQIISRSAFIGLRNKRFLKTLGRIQIALKAASPEAAVKREDVTSIPLTRKYRNYNWLIVKELATQSCRGQALLRFLNWDVSSIENSGLYDLPTWEKHTFWI